MNVFDVIIYIALAWAVFNGWRKGFLLQLVSLFAVAAGFFIATKCGVAVGSMLGLSGATASIVGFLAIFVVSLIAIIVGGYLLRAVLRLTGLGVADIVLGILFSVLKIGLVVGVLFSWFAALNANYTLVEPATIEQSHLFSPLVNVIDWLTPYFHNAASEMLNR
ncbi:MAG: CvpA family protein [Alistipes sp.]|nr:CvpA family protein [Alistipes sp.]